MKTIVKIVKLKKTSIGRHAESLTDKEFKWKVAIYNSYKREKKMKIIVIKAKTVRITKVMIIINNDESITVMTTKTIN